MAECMDSTSVKLSSPKAIFSIGFEKRTVLTVNSSLHTHREAWQHWPCVGFNSFDIYYEWKSRSLTNSVWDEITFRGETDWCLWPTTTIFINKRYSFAEMCEWILNWNLRNMHNIWIYPWKTATQSIRAIYIDRISDFKKYPLTSYL